MGWASGSELMCEVINAVEKELQHVGKDRMIPFYERIINAFEDHDCDTLDECRGIDPLFDKALDAVHPPEENDA